MLLDVSYYGHRELIEEDVLVICVEEKIKEILAEREARRHRPRINNKFIEESYAKLMKGEKVMLG